MILVYAFSNPWGTNISRRTLSEFQKIIPNSNIEFQIVRYHPHQFFQKYILNSKYELIIGLGDLYGDFSKVHIETRAKNVYHQQPIHPFYPIFLDLSIPPLDYYDSNLFSISSNMGSFNCNWIAFSIEVYFDQKKLKSQQLFFHLPQKQNAFILASQIKNILEINKLI